MKLQSKNVLTVLNKLKSIQPYVERGKLSMMQGYISSENGIKIHACGTVHCMAGWYWLADEANWNRKDRFIEEGEVVGYDRGKVALIEDLFGGEDMDEELRRQVDHCRDKDWIGKSSLLVSGAVTPYWNPRYVEDVRYLFLTKCPYCDKGEKLTWQHIIDRWEDVYDNVLKEEQENCKLILIKGDKDEENECRNQSHEPAYANTERKVEASEGRGGR